MRPSLLRVVTSDGATHTYLRTLYGVMRVRSTLPTLIAAPWEPPRPEIDLPRNLARGATEEARELRAAMGAA